MNSIPAKFLAWLATVFGGLGTFIGLVGIILVWIGAAQFSGMMGRISTQIDQATERVTERAGQATARIEESRTSLGRLELRLTEKLAKAAAGGQLAPESFDDLELRLQIFSQRLEDWQQIALAIRDFGDAGIELLSGFPGIVSSHEQAITRLRASLGRVETLVGESAAALDKMEGLLTKVREGTVGEKAIEEFQPLFKRIDRALLKAVAQTHVFSKGMTVIGGVARQATERMWQRTNTVAIVLTLLLLWQAAGQYCLARWGRANR